MLPQAPEEEEAGGVEMLCWQDLPSDIVRSVAERVSGVDDFLRLGAVCRPWSEALTGFRPPVLGHFPWLVSTAKLTSTSNKEEEEVVLLPMYSPNNHRVNTFPVPAGGGCSRVVGRHRGWLVTVDDSFDFRVFNPVTGDRASLPSFSTLMIEGLVNARDVFFKKVALSSTPSGAGGSSSEVVAAAVVYCFKPANAFAIAFAKVGDDTWSGRIGLPFFVTDVIYFRGSFFVVDITGRYQIIDPPSGPPQPPRLAAASWIPPMFRRSGFYFNFMVSPSSGHLLAVDGSTDGCVFIKYNPPPSSRPWVEVKDLGDEALFLGGGYAMLLPVAAGNSSIRRNCVYFVYGCGDDELVSMFDVGKGVCEDPLLDLRPLKNNSSSWPLITKSSSWFMPTLS